jgi:hypothetical protein
MPDGTTNALCFGYGQDRTEDVLRQRQHNTRQNASCMTAGNQAEVTMPTTSPTPVKCTFVVDDGHRDDGTHEGYWVDGGCHMELP